MTDLNKPVRRRTAAFKRDGGRVRRIVLTMYPAGFIGLRLERTRREEALPVAAAFDVAVKMRVAFERAQKRKAKQAKGTP